MKATNTFLGLSAILVQGVVAQEICGGFAGAQCSNGAPCKFLPGADFGYCPTQMCGGFAGARCSNGAKCVFLPGADYGWCPVTSKGSAKREAEPALSPRQDQEICGGFAGAECSNGAPCKFLPGADFGYCPNEICGGFAGAKCSNGAKCVFLPGADYGWCPVTSKPAKREVEPTTLSPRQEICGGFAGAECSNGAPCTFLPGADFGYCPTEICGGFAGAECSNGAKCTFLPGADYGWCPVDTKDKREATAPKAPRADGLEECGGFAGAECSNGAPCKFLPGADYGYCPTEMCGGFAGAQCSNGAPCKFLPGADYGWCPVTPDPKTPIARDREICGGFAGAECSNGAPCKFLPGADFGYCPSKPTTRDAAAPEQPVAARQEGKPAPGSNETDIYGGVVRICGTRGAKPCPDGFVCHERHPGDFATDRGGVCIFRIACNGLGAPACPKNTVCVDDPRDDCSVAIPEVGCPAYCAPVEEKTKPFSAISVRSTKTATASATPSVQYCGGKRAQPSPPCPKGQVCVNQVPNGLLFDYPGICIDRVFCGGIAALPCKEGYTCVEDPTDPCTAAGGADCGGYCYPNSGLSKPSVPPPPRRFFQA